MPPPVAKGPREIKLVSHSSIFYWWPIWVLGYALALLTWYDGTRLAILPPQSDLRALADDKDKARYELSVANRWTPR